jgi:hypothetical protein
VLMSEGRLPYRRSAEDGALCEVGDRLVPRRELAAELESRFRPLRPASTPRLALAVVFGPVAWALCISFAVLFVEPTREIVVGAIVAGISFAASALVLSLLRWGRMREERAHVDAP